MQITVEPVQHVEAEASSGAGDRPVIRVAKSGRRGARCRRPIVAAKVGAIEALGRGREPGRSGRRVPVSRLEAKNGRHTGA